MMWIEEIEKVGEKKRARGSWYVQLIIAGKKSVNYGNGQN